MILAREHPAPQSSSRAIERSTDRQRTHHARRRERERVARRRTSSSSARKERVRSRLNRTRDELSESARARDVVVDGAIGDGGVYVTVRRVVERGVVGCARGDARRRALRVYGRASVSPAGSNARESDEWVEMRAMWGD